MIVLSGVVFRDTLTKQRMKLKNVNGRGTVEIVVITPKHVFNRHIDGERVSRIEKGARFECALVQPHPVHSHRRF